MAARPPAEAPMPTMGKVDLVEEMIDGESASDVGSDVGSGGGCLRAGFLGLAIV